MERNDADANYVPTHLQDALRAAAYLDSILATGDSSAFLVALRHVVYARLGGMTQLATSAALNRKSLYRMLSERGSPGLKTVEKVLNAAGLRLAVTVREPSIAQRDSRTTADQAPGHSHRITFQA